MNIENKLVISMFSILVIGVFFVCLCQYYQENAQGKASWYSNESSGKYTATGELFNDEDMTCAMRYKKFGGLYLVCNKDNNKCVMVRHNDYGPNKRFKKRIVDLSKGAFEKIADLDEGIINVKVRRIR